MKEIINKSSNIPVIFSIVAILLICLTPVAQAKSYSQIEREVRLREQGAKEYVDISNKSTSNYNTTWQPFIDQFGINGSVSCAMMPPSPATFNETEDTQVVSQIIEFSHKDIMEGSSVQWWRTPFQRMSDDLDIRLDLYKVESVKQSDLSLEPAEGGWYSPQLNWVANSNHIYKNTYSASRNHTYHKHQSTTFRNFTYNFSYVRTNAPIYSGGNYLVVWQWQQSSSQEKVYFTQSDVGSNDYYNSTGFINHQSSPIEKKEWNVNIATDVLHQYGQSSKIAGQPVKHRPEIIAPTKPYPKDGQTDIPTTINLGLYLKHTINPTSLTIDYYGWAEGNSSSLIGSDTINSQNFSTSPTWSNLSEGIDYWWYAVIEDDYGNTYTTINRTFKTEINGTAQPTNPEPANGSTDKISPQNISVYVEHQAGKDMEVQFYNAKNGNLIGSRIASSGTRAEVTWESLSESTTYYWEAYAYNVDNHDDFEKSYVFQFTTADNFPTASTTDDNNITDDYSLLSPLPPSDPNPPDGEQNVDSEGGVELSVEIQTTGGESADVTFYDASDDSIIDTDSAVADGGRAYTTWNEPVPDNIYSWYAKAESNGDNATSNTFSFSTASELTVTNVEILDTFFSRVRLKVEFNIGYYSTANLTIAYEESKNPGYLPKLYTTIVSKNNYGSKIFYIDGLQGNTNYTLDFALIQHEEDDDVLNLYSTFETDDRFGYTVTHFKSKLDSPVWFNHITKRQQMQIDILEQNSSGDYKINMTDNEGNSVVDWVDSLNQSLPLGLFKESITFSPFIFHTNILNNYSITSSTDHHVDRDDIKVYRGDGLITPHGLGVGHDYTFYYNPTISNAFSFTLPVYVFNEHSSNQSTRLGYEIECYNNSYDNHITTYSGEFQDIENYIFTSEWAMDILYEGERFDRVDIEIFMKGKDDIAFWMEDRNDIDDEYQYTHSLVRRANDPTNLTYSGYVPFHTLQSHSYKIINEKPPDIAMEFFLPPEQYEIEDSSQRTMIDVIWDGIKWTHPAYISYRMFKDVVIPRLKEFFGSKMMDETVLGDIITTIDNTIGDAIRWIGMKFGEAIDFIVENAEWIIYTLIRIGAIVSSFGIFMGTIWLASKWVNYWYLVSTETLREANDYMRREGKTVLNLVIFIGVAVFNLIVILLNVLQTMTGPLT